MLVGAGGRVRRRKTHYLRRLYRKVVNRPMPEEARMAPEPTKSEPGYRRRPYSESYRHLYGLRQDVLNKTRQLEQSLDTVVLYVRDLLR